MLENVLNNVKATHEIQKNKNISTKKTDKKDEKNENEESFQTLLQKNLIASKIDTSKAQKNQKSPITTTLQTQEQKETKETQNHKNPIKSNNQKDLATEKEILFSQTHQPQPTQLPKQEKQDLTQSNTVQKTPIQKDLPQHTPVQSDIVKKETPKIISEAKPLPQEPEKKISDIKTLGEQKNLQPKNINLEHSKPTKTDSPKTNPSDSPTPSQTKSTPTQTQTPDNPLIKQSTQNVLDQKLKTPIVSHKTDEAKPLLSALKAIDEKELKTRKKFNQAHKIEYKLEGKNEKIAIIERGKNLPKNIVGPRIYQEKLEAKLEQTQTQPKNSTLQEAITQVLTKEIKPKIANTQQASQDVEAKDSTQKKTKKSSTLTKTTQTQIQSSNTPESTLTTKSLEQSKLPQNQQEILENNTQISLFEKNKKKQNDQEVQATKEKSKENIPKEKDSTSSVSLAPKTDLLYKTVNAKETIKNFAQNFGEEIKNYKPPMTKISLELHPEKLGKLELTIKQVGKNLQVSVVSNHQAIALFVQNQAELRQNLAMIGFSGVDLSFSSQERDSEQKQQDSNKQKRNKNSLKQYEEVKNISQIQYDTMEMILPKYA